MPRSRFVRFLIAILLIPAAILCSPVLGRPQTPSSAALAGRVSSQEEGPMEGVLVSAKKTGSTVAVTVVSDAQGRYSFPRARLEPGRYALRIRAGGYDLNDPGPVEISAQKTAQLDLKLVKTKDLAAQLTNSEWLMSAPGTDAQKIALLECTGCHSLERVVRSSHDAAEFKEVLQRMATYDPGSTVERPQIAIDGPRKSPASAEYLSTINLSKAPQWQYALKTMPRPKGKATRVIITEYDLPRPECQPHDAIVDSEGMVWYGDFSNQVLGRLNPKTAKVVEYPVPVLKTDVPIGYRVLWFDPDGNIWISLASQAGIAKFDRKTQKFQTWSVPSALPNERATMVQPGDLNVDGKVWLQMRGGKVQRLDVKTGEWDREPIDLFKTIGQKLPAAAKRPHSIYDSLSDSQNNIYFTDFSSEFIGKVNAKTKEITYYQTPTFNSGPRRGRMDRQGRFWFGEDRAGRFAMFDPKTERIQEWLIPTPFNAAYDVVVDKNGDAWEGAMMSDRVARLNPKTGEIVEYLMPRSTSIRKVEVDNSTSPVTFWAGSNLGASIVKVEPLE
jgi:streptogramin lyase